MEEVKWVRDKVTTRGSESDDEGKVLLLSTEKRDEIEEEEEVEGEDSRPAEPELSAKPHSKLTSYLSAVAFFSIIGGFLFGYDTSVISGALLILDKDYDYSLTALQKELVVSITIGAAAVGAVLGGPSNELLGRRPTIMIASTIFTVGAILMAAAPISAWGWIVILIGRFVVGAGIGLASMTVPMYLAECSPSSFRGRLTVLDNMAVTCGQFVAGVIDFGFSYVDQGWRYMLGLAAIPSLIRLVAFLFLPESPRWLVGKGKTQKARSVLTKLRGRRMANEEAIACELQEITDNLHEAAKENSQNIFLKLWTMLRHRHLLTALVVGCGLQAIQQLSGINTVMYYSPTIMKMAGVEDNHFAIGLGAIVAFGNFVFTMIGFYCVEKFGRRNLILSSLAGVILSLIVLAVAFYFAHTTTQPACPTDTCSLNSCDDCVIQDNCFYCLFPYNATYGQEEATGFCVNREWTNSQGKCWVPDTVALHQSVVNNETCDISFLVSGHDSPPNDTSHYGTMHSSCPNTFSWLAMIALVMYIASFAPGMGPVPWTVNAEIYPNWARSTGNSLSSTTNWVSNLLVSITFLHLTQYLTRYGAFSLYVGLATFGWLFIFLLLPETKGKSLEQVECLFKGPPCPPPGLRSNKRSYNSEQSRH